jgi:DNA-binding NtrC family response regulator
MSRIIFVDDEPRVLEALRRGLRIMRDEWEMSFVSSGMDALGLMNEKQFDAIVSDMMMPGMSGQELLERVKSTHPTVARIVLSGHCDQEAAFRLIGSDHFFLSKPCSRDLLKQTIELAILSHGSVEQEPEALSAEALASALDEYFKTMLLKQKISPLDIPEIFRSRLSEVIADQLAPVVDDYSVEEQLGDFTAEDIYQSWLCNE